jgi:hypothetical protein
MVAIDLTGSNGHPLDAGSLHYYGGGNTQPNEYLQVRASCKLHVQHRRASKTGIQQMHAAAPSAGGQQRCILHSCCLHGEQIRSI